MLEGSSKEERALSVDLGTSEQDTVQVDISDALSEKDRVKFTVHTQTKMSTFAKADVSVTRDHDEFIWLHDAIQENEDYLGYIVPPPPPRPDFDQSRRKLQELGEGEALMTKDEFSKMKAELEAEYLAAFKKTVAMHEVFLHRLATHPKFKYDSNFRIFLEYEKDLAVRRKNAKEKLGGLLGKLGKSADEVLLSGQKDIDDFFEIEKNYLIEYHAHIKDATAKSDRATRYHKMVADSFIKTATVLEKLATMEHNDTLKNSLMYVAGTLEKSRKMEARVSTDEDLKQSDPLRYYMRETQAAKHLLYRRSRCLANYEGANRTLERARAKSKDVQRAELEQQQACERYETITEVARGELKDLKTRRVSAFAKAMVELAELELKQAKAHANHLSAAAATLRDI